MPTFKYKICIIGEANVKIKYHIDFSEYQSFVVKVVEAMGPCCVQKRSKSETCKYVVFIY